MAAWGKGEECKNCRKRNNCKDREGGTLWCYGYRKDKAVSG